MSINTTQFIANPHEGSLGDPFTNFALLQNLPKLKSNIGIIDYYTELLLQSRSIEKADSVGHWIHSTLLSSALGFKDSEIKMKTADFNLPSMVKDFGLENTFCLLTHAYRMSHQVFELNGEYQNEALIAKKFFYQQLQMLAKRYPTSYVNFLKQYTAGKIVALDRASIDPQFVEKLQKNNQSLNGKIAKIAIGLIALSGLAAIAARTAFSEGPSHNPSNNTVVAHQPTPSTITVVNLPVQKEILTSDPCALISTAQTFQEYILELESKRPSNKSLSTISLTAPTPLNNKFHNIGQKLTDLENADLSLEETDPSANSYTLHSLIGKIIIVTLVVGGFIACFWSKKKKEADRKDNETPKFLIVKNTADGEKKIVTETGNNKEEKDASNTSQESTSSKESDFNPLGLNQEAWNAASNVFPLTTASNITDDNPYGISFLQTSDTNNNNSDSGTKNRLSQIIANNRLSTLVTNCTFGPLMSKLRTFSQTSNSQASNIPPSSSSQQSPMTVSKKFKQRMQEALLKENPKLNLNQLYLEYYDQVKDNVILDDIYQFGCSIADKISEIRSSFQDNIDVTTFVRRTFRQITRSYAKINLGEQLAQECEELYAKCYPEASNSLDYDDLSILYNRLTHIFPTPENETQWEKLYPSLPYETENTDSVELDILFRELLDICEKVFDTLCKDIEEKQLSDKDLVEFLKESQELALIKKITLFVSGLNPKKTPDYQDSLSNFQEAWRYCLEGQNEKIKILGKSIYDFLA